MQRANNFVAVIFFNYVGYKLDYIMELGQKYFLGDGENYFIYRTDKYNEETIRADLFNKNGEIIAKTLVKGGMINANKTHHQVVEEFEVAVMR